MVFQLWGVDIISSNAVNWLDCVAKGQKVTMKPIACDKDELVSTLLLHLPQPKVSIVVVFKHQINWYHSEILTTMSFNFLD